MSFLKSFFAAMAANEISEKKRAERERKSAEKKQLNDEIRVLHLEQEFLDYMMSINCRNVSDFDEAISAKHSSEDAWQTKRVIDHYKEKLKEYMRLGGEPAHITEFAKMDLYIEIVRRLKEYGWLDKQDQYVKYADDTYWLDRDWEQAQKTQHKSVQIAAIVDTPGNEINAILKSSDVGFIPFGSKDEAILIDTAKSNDEASDSFLDFLTVSISFTDKSIIIYSEEHDEIYYKADVAWKNVEISTAPITGWNWSLIEINGLSLLFDSGKIAEVVSLYESHNSSLEKDIQRQYTIAYDNINSLTGVEFENVCKRLLESMGFAVETTKITGDGGIDLIAYNSQPLLSGKYIIQCKRYTGSVGEPVIRDLFGVVTAERANKGILMTTGHFTKSAIAFAENKPIELIDGIALKNLFSQYGLNVVATSTATTTRINKSFVDVMQGMSMAEVVQENWELEDSYDEFLSLKDAADRTNDEATIAEYINWLIEKNDFQNFILCDFEQRRVCFQETNTYITKFLQIRKSKKSNLLSYLYQMVYVQNSILLERFNDAKTMFIKMMSDKGIQFNLFETMRETHNTADIFENTGVFSFLFATWCNMYQMASVCNDLGLREYLTDDDLFYGVPIMQNTRIEDNLELIRSGKSGLNELYFQKQQKLIQEIDGWYNNEPAQMKIFFKVDSSEIINSFYDYAYHGGETIDTLLEFCDYTLENGEMELDNYGTISLDNALGAYVPFSKSDLS